MIPCIFKGFRAVVRKDKYRSISYSSMYSKIIIIKDALGVER